MCRAVVTIIGPTLYSFFSWLWRWLRYIFLVKEMILLHSSEKDDLLSVLFFFMKKDDLFHWWWMWSLLIYYSRCSDVDAYLLRIGGSYTVVICNYQVTLFYYIYKTLIKDILVGETPVFLKRRGKSNFWFCRQLKKMDIWFSCATLVLVVG